MEEKDNAMAHICTECGKVFHKKYALTVHMRTHTREKPFKCEVCGKCFAVPDGVKRHAAAHMREKPSGERKGTPVLHTCSECGKGFRGKFKLAIHMRTHTGERPYKCEICGKCFAVQDTLKGHARVHTGEKPFSCHLCYKKFKDKNVLKNHILRHKGERTYICKLCNRGYNTNADLATHVKSHSNVRSFTCDICGSAFLYNSALQRHISSVHLKMKNYTCDICGNKFFRKYGLIEHKKTHSRKENDRVFECKVCGKKYFEHAHLLKHELIHNPNAFRCSICSRLYETKSALEKHLARHEEKNKALMEASDDEYTSEPHLFVKVELGAPADCEGTSENKIFVKIEPETSDAIGNGDDECTIETNILVKKGLVICRASHEEASNVGKEFPIKVKQELVDSSNEGSGSEGDDNTNELKEITYERVQSVAVSGHSSKVRNSKTVELSFQSDNECQNDSDPLAL